jgi:hypothetical protein
MCRVSGDTSFADMAPAVSDLLLGLEQTSSRWAQTSVLDSGCSLIPGLRSRLSKNILAGFMVLSAVGTWPPHDGLG